MGEIGGCLKAVFVFFNTLFTVRGAVRIYGLLSTSPAQNQMDGLNDLSITVAWVDAIAMIGISLLGSYAACTESKGCLRVFAVFMGIGTVIMLIFVVVLIDERNQGLRGPWNDYYMSRDDNVELGFKNGLGILFRWSFIALMGLIIAVYMIHQISRHERDPVPAFAMRAY